MAILEIENLTKKYREVTALSGVSLKVRRGEFVTVIGRSGAGKSTLLRCVNRLIDATAGQITFDSMEVLSLKAPGPPRAANAHRHDLPALQSRPASDRH